METVPLGQLKLSGRRPHPACSRVWREWCLLRVALRHFRGRFLLLLGILFGGGLLFVVCEPEQQHSLPRGMYYTWVLIFGQPPEEYPQSAVLQVLFFAVPVLGLIVILEGIVDFALMLRDRRRNERSWCKEMAASLSNHVILVGLGKLGIRSFRLLRRLGETVVVIEHGDDNQFLDEIRRDGAPLFIGDARREAFLHDAHVENAKSIIVATNHDLVNLEVALDARRMNPRIRVVLRMFDQNMADKICEGLDLQIAMSQSAISAPAFVMAAVDSSITNSLIIGDELVVTEDWFVHQDGPLCGRTVAEVMTAYRVGVVERRPAGGARQLQPPPDVQLLAGDGLLVQGRYEVLRALRERETRLTVGNVKR